METRIFEIIPTPLTFEPIEIKCGKERRRERRKKMRK
jgi:hypothetical protein